MSFCLLGLLLMVMIYVWVLRLVRVFIVFLKGNGVLEEFCFLVVKRIMIFGIFLVVWFIMDVVVFKVKFILCGLLI